MKKILFFSFVALAGVFFLLTQKTSVATPPAEIKSAEEGSVEATIVSVGDIFLHDNNLSAAYDAKTKKYNFNSAFSFVADYFKQADLSTAWLGGVMSTSGPYSGYPSFRSPAALVDALQNMGLDIAFRTNHTMDFGIKGLEKTTQIIKEHSLNQVAAHATEADSKNIFIYQKGDLKIAVLGYIYGMNGLPIPKSWMINLIDLKKIKSDVVKAKTQADFVIVALHFGTEYERYPNKWQKNTVKQIADYGADMIIGSHPHVLQTADMVTSTDGRQVFVAYGLGNFYCGQRMHYTDAGAILKYIIEKTNGVAKLKSVSFIPTWVAEYRDKGKTQYKILPSKQYIDLYKQGKASFLSIANFNRLKTTYQETIKHLTNLKIGFTEY